MSSLICEQNFYKTENSRSRMIGALRAALNAAESGENEVTIIYDNLEINWDYEHGEFFVIG
jgi:hypothetical protein